MIPRSTLFDLGLDRTRIKDLNDAARQARTVDALLERFFADDPAKRYEVQVLADEVGMGKTYVALGVAFSILEAIRAGEADEDLRGCYQKILVISPRNPMLLRKWVQEVKEFVKRCIPADRRADASWFEPTQVDRLDDLSSELRRRGPGRRVLVASMGIFSGEKLQNYDLKRRLLLGTLFRFWGPKFRTDRRLRLLKGAPAGWPTKPDDLTELTAKEEDRLCFGESDLLRALERVADELLQKLLDKCNEISEPYTRDRDAHFAAVERLLTQIYKEAALALINLDLPLVIVDEAHNWRNRASGFDTFSRVIAPHMRRALLLSATPFQLHPRELLTVLEATDAIRPAPRQADAAVRAERLRKHRADVIDRTLEASNTASRHFSTQWQRLPARVTTAELDASWQSPVLVAAREQLAALAESPGVLATTDADRVITPAIGQVDPDLRSFVREALRLYAANRDLSQELGELVIRHRRRTDHRLFRVGSEYSADVSVVAQRPDAHVLHPAPGLDVRGDAELPQFLLMRCVSEMKRLQKGRGRSSLGTALTGCWSTLLHSADGHAVCKALEEDPRGKIYLELLKGLVSAENDRDHPKVREVVEAVVRAWNAGEKTLIFCFRLNTADRLRAVIDERLRSELDQRRQRCFGGEESLKTLRKRLTARTESLVGLGLDRFLWSLHWADPKSGIGPDDFVLSDGELQELARIALRCQVDLLVDSNKLDRVFLNRAIESVLAQRLSGRVTSEPARSLLKRMAELSWVERPYGEGEHEVEAGEEAERATFDERGAHHHYEVVPNVPKSAVADLAAKLAERRAHATKTGQTSLFDSYRDAPSLWLGAAPRTGEHAGLLRLIHGHLLALSFDDDGSFHPRGRALVLQAMRRSVFREAVLLRLLPDEAEREEEAWGPLLARAFFTARGGGLESLAMRTEAFLEDLKAASGDITRRGDRRFGLYDATKLRDQQFVALVKGNMDAETKERLFTGFNTPLMPEVLICTSVGQEGIDLHRHCRKVIHYDLAWNPAVIEQRTGRADRIGSKTFRERALAPGAQVYLEVGVPFLAGTYDERMFEEVRLRAQTFEILTGGDLVVDNDAAGADEETRQAEGQELGVRLVVLPDALVKDLRVRLHVWSEPVPAPSVNVTPPVPQGA